MALAHTGKIKLVDMIVEYLYKHPEGTTAIELAKAIGAQLAVLNSELAKMALSGDVIKARDKKPMKVTWDIGIDYGYGSYKQSTNRQVEHIEHKDVWRLSPDKWIEITANGQG